MKIELNDYRFICSCWGWGGVGVLFKFSLNEITVTASLVDRNLMYLRLTERSENIDIVNDYREVLNIINKVQ